MAKLIVDVKAAVDGPQIDGPRLRKLLDEIERFRVETGQASLARRDRPDLRHTDAARLPAAYRDRIERYFEMLSEE
jgi:hypothetical protein